MPEIEIDEIAPKTPWYKNRQVLTVGATAVVALTLGAVAGYQSTKLVAAAVVENVPTA